MSWLYSRVPGLRDAVGVGNSDFDDFSDDDSLTSKDTASAMFNFMLTPRNMQQLAVGSINLYVRLRDGASSNKEYQQYQEAAKAHNTKYPLESYSFETIKECLLKWPQEGKLLTIDDDTYQIVMTHLCLDLAGMNPKLATSENFNHLLELAKEAIPTIIAGDAVSLYLELAKQLAFQNKAQVKLPQFMPKPACVFASYDSLPLETIQKETLPSNHV